MTNRKPRIVQEQFFPLTDVMGEHFTLMRYFLSGELRGKRLSSEKTFMVTFEVLGIAASSLAQTLAYCRGYVNPESDVFASENFVARMNPLDSSDDDPFSFDINHDPNFELHDLERINAYAIYLLAERALAMARVVVYEVEREERLRSLVEQK